VTKVTNCPENAIMAQTASHRINQTRAKPYSACVNHKYFPTETLAYTTDLTISLAQQLIDAIGEHHYQSAPH